MDCPFCGSAMEHGKIHTAANTGIGWYPGGTYPSARDLWSSGPWRKMLARVVFKPFVGYLLEADFCHKCKKMIFETDIKT